MDVERLLHDWAVTRPNITDLIDTRYYTVLPEKKTWPLIRGVLIDQQQLAEPTRALRSCLVQFDFYGTDKNTSHTLGETFLNEATDHLPGTHDLGVVGGLKEVTFGYLPDTDFTNARPRYQATVEIFIREAISLPPS